jgi:hypothetical protein
MRALLYSLVAGAFLLAGCTKDNVDPPKSTLTGRVVFEDQAVGVRNNSTTNAGNTSTMLELWQRGYQLFTKIPVYVAQDGTFSAVLFDGDYKLVRTRGNGPWVDNTDTIEVKVRGATNVNVPIQPYYVVRNETFQKDGNTVKATCQASRITATAAGRAVTLDRVVLFIGSTQFVDNNNTVGRNELTGAAVADLSKPLSFSLAVPASIKGFCYVRIGIKATNSAEYLYTPVQKISF